MKIKILYENKDILVIDKPSGISVHADGRSKPARNASSIAGAGGEETISDWFIKKYPKAKNVGESIFVDNKASSVGGLPSGVALRASQPGEIKKPGIVHRLDRETSGVLLLAKNQKAFEFLKSQFKNREIKKTYNALVSGFVKNDRAVINKPIGRSPVDFRRRLAGRGARGELREAITEYKVLKRFICPSLHPSQREGKKLLSPSLRGGLGGAKFTFLEIKPKTGRTHQIRVHMKYSNYPVICDSLYNPKGFCPKELGRLALHARYIEFKDLKGKIIKTESELPKDIEKIILKLQKN
ncbi:MAG: RluA family pseudouridine synthase [Patescibacteria group bacterium]